MCAVISSKKEEERRQTAYRRFAQYLASKKSGASISGLFAEYKAGITDRGPEVCPPGDWVQFEAVPMKDKVVVTVEFEIRNAKPTSALFKHLAENFNVKTQ